jgi:hypothetical protein
MKRIWTRLTDNRFWYIGYTSTQFGDRDYDKAFCLIVRNPFDRSWKCWEEAKSFHKRKHEERMSDPDYMTEYTKAFNKAIDKTI